MSEFLFPNRRSFLAGAAGAAAGLALGGSLAAQEKAPVILGSGKTKFQLDESWGKLPEGMSYGLGCALVVDSKDRIFVTSRSVSPCVAIFDKTGKLEATWSKELTAAVGFEKNEQVRATAHGLYLSKEGGQEFLYWTENVANFEGKKIGARVYKTDLNGKVLYTLGNVEKDGDTTQKVGWTNPTDVAVAPNGDIYIVDGYGSQTVYRFDKNFKLLNTIGGRGTAADHGKFNTCHGVWVSTLRKEPEVYIADRANNRIEVFSPDLEYKRTIPEMRQPCCFYQHDGLMYIPELGARVSIIDADDKVVARLGDGAGDAEAEKKPEKFKTPHALTLNSAGDLFVIEWVAFGRPRRFAKVA